MILSRYRYSITVTNRRPTLLAFTKFYRYKHYLNFFNKTLNTFSKQPRLVTFVTVKFVNGQQTDVDVTSGNDGWRMSENDNGR
jgi:hypothetical protein